MAAIDDLLSGINSAQSVVGGGSQVTSGNFRDDGFVVQNNPNSDGNRLPAYGIASNRQNAKQVRRVISWFVPEFGVVKMYINPESIQYTEAKTIQKQRTKGGFVVQYWGEELTTLTISGTTGTSGIEGLQLLEQIYRSEQLAFDAIGLTLASGAATQIDQISDSIGDLIGGNVGSIIGDIAGDALGTNPGVGNILPQSIPSLASMALGIEMFWDGWVFRGYFNSFNFSETANNLGMYTYNIQFTVTQRRGYRVNSMPWQRSAVDGPSSSAVPHTFAGGYYGYSSSPTISSGQQLVNSNSLDNSTVRGVGDVFTTGSRQQQNR